MNWDLVAAVSEVVGAFAVVLSLLYLATQIRHSTKTTEDAAFRDVFSALTVQWASMVEGPNADVMLKGLDDFKSLCARDKYVFDGLMAGFVTLAESTILSHDAKFISDETMDNWGCLVRTRYLPYKGWRDWWRESKEIYHPHAQVWFDRQLEKTDEAADF
jgi:hypothetical protein